MVVDCLRLEVTLSRVFPFVGKFSMMQAPRVSLAAARVASRCESDLSIESCLVALSTARRGSVRERAPIGVQYGPLVGGDSVI